jgi:hypothetical protein
MVRHKEYYKGEDGGFPQVWVMVSLVSSCLPVVHSCTKNVSAMHLTNLLFGLCKSVRIIDLLVTLLNPHLETPAYPSTLEVLRTRKHAPTPCPSIVFTLWTHYRNPNLRLATKVKACKGVGQEGSPRVTSHALGSVGECEGMNLHIPK